MEEYYSYCSPNFDLHWGPCVVDAQQTNKKTLKFKESHKVRRKKSRKQDRREQKVSNRQRIERRKRAKQKIKILYKYTKIPDPLIEEILEYLKKHKEL